MSLSVLGHFGPSIDLFDPANTTSIVDAMWHAQYGRDIPPDIYVMFWDRDVSFADQLCGEIFSSRNMENAADAAHRLVCGISSDKGAKPYRPFAVAPGWFDLFHQLLKRGHISARTWGKLARLIYTARDVTGIAGSAHHATTLAGLRDACPLGLMDGSEYALWSSLPDCVRAYRGAANCNPTSASQGISWADRPEVAMGFAKDRSLDLLANHSCPVTVQTVQCDIPKPAVFAVLKWEEADYCEYLTDYTLIPVSTPVSLGNLK